MSKTKGANGPLTLRCPKCGARNVGPNQPIDLISSASRYRKSGRTTDRRMTVMVQCKAVAWPADLTATVIERPAFGPICGHTWWTNHTSMLRLFEKRQQQNV